LAEDQIKIGDSVTVMSLRGAYTVAEGPDRKGQYLVVQGQLRLWVAAIKLSKFIPLTNKPSKRQLRKAHSHPSSAPSKRAPPPNPRLDLHGLKVSEALARVEQLLDAAVLTGIPQLEIIHGIGTGAIMKAVHDYLGRYPHVSAFKLDERNRGTTWVYL